MIDTRFHFFNLVNLLFIFFISVDCSVGALLC